MEDFTEIRILAAKLNPVETLGVLALYSGVRREGGREVSESGLEIVQYLFLTTEQVESPETPDAEQIIQLIDFTNVIHERILMSRLKKMRYSNDVELKFMAELARFGVQDYRNWSYAKETIEIIDEMVEPISEYIKECVGYNLKAFSVVAEHIFTKVFGETRIVTNLENKQLSELSDVEFVSQLLLKENLYQCIARYWLDTELLSKQFDINKDDIIKVVDGLSFQVGKESLDFEGVYENNTISFKPFIKLSEDQFIIFSISALNSFYMEMLGQMVQGNKSALDSLNRRRSKYVELKAFEIFKKYFPQCEIYNDYYLDGFDSNQKDIIMKYGDVIYIIEVKSNGIKKGLRNAGVLSLKNFLKDTVVSAHNQTLDVKEKINGGAVVRTAKTKDFSFIIDPLKTRKICRLVVMFRDLGGLHTNLRNLRGLTGHLGEDISVMTLTDLMVVFDILSCPSERLDYLLQRLKIEKELDYLGDEVDLLGYYLLNRFDVDYRKYQGVKMKFDGLSEPVDSYKVSEFIEPKAIKPKFEITDFWKNLMISIEDSLKANSRPIVSQMYRVSVRDQHKLQEDLKSMFSDIKFRVDMQSYDYIEYIEVKSNVLFRITVIKQPNLRLFKGDKRSLARLTNKNHKEIFVVYLNAMNGGEYVGSLVLSKRNKNGHRVTPLVLK